MREIAKKLKISDNAWYYSLHRAAQNGSNQNRKRSGRPRCTTEQEDKYIRVSSLRNRRVTSPQPAASLNSTHKTPVSTSTVKWRLRDAGLPGIVPLSGVCVLLPILIFINIGQSEIWLFLWNSLQQHPRVASSLVFCGYYLMKLPVEDLWGVCFSI